MSEIKLQMSEKTEKETTTARDVLTAEAVSAIFTAVDEAEANGLEYVAAALRDALRMLAAERADDALAAINALNQYATRNAPLQPDASSAEAMRVAQARTEVIATFIHYARREA